MMRFPLQGGNLMEGLPEQLRVQLGTKDDTAFLRRLLVEPTCQPGSAELSGDMQPRLWTCLQVGIAALSTWNFCLAT